jgi:hypothetical protein
MDGRKEGRKEGRKDIILMVVPEIYSAMTIDSRLTDRQREREKQSNCVGLK